MMAGMHPEELELLAYLEGELDDPRHAEVASHLEACDRCAQELRSVESGRAALRSAPMLELPSGRLEAMLTRCRPRCETAGLIRQVLPVAAALAAVAALAGGAFVLGTIDGGDDESASAPAQGEASDAGGGGEAVATTGGATTDKRQSGSVPLKAVSVAGSPATVARRLRSDGFDARRQRQSDRPGCDRGRGSESARDVGRRSGPRRRPTLIPRARTATPCAWTHASSGASGCSFRMASSTRTRCSAFPRRCARRRPSRPRSPEAARTTWTRTSPQQVGVRLE